MRTVQINLIAALASLAWTGVALARLAGLQFPVEVGQFVAVFHVVAMGAWVALVRTRGATASLYLYAFGVALWIVGPAASFELPVPPDLAAIIPPLTFGLLVLGLGGLMVSASRGTSPWLNGVVWVTLALQLADLALYFTGRGSIMGAGAQAVMFGAAALVMLTGKDGPAAAASAPNWRVVERGAALFRASILVRVALMALLLVVGIGVVAGPRPGTSSQLWAFVSLAGNVVVAGLLTSSMWWVARGPLQFRARQIAAGGWAASVLALSVSLACSLFIVAIASASPQLSASSISSVFASLLAFPVAALSILTLGAFIIVAGRAGQVLKRGELSSLVIPALLMLCVAELLTVLRSLPRAGASPPSIGLNLVIIAANVTLIVLLLRLANWLGRAARDAALATHFEG